MSDPELRSEQEVVTRALCLAAVRLRVTAETLFKDAECPDGYVEFCGGEPKETPDIILRWLKKENLLSELSPQETGWLTTPIGHLSRRDAIDASWREEALVSLLWALGIVDPMPAPDTQLDFADLLEATNLLRDSQLFWRRVAIRPDVQVNSARGTAEFWLWRVRTEQLIRMPDEELTMTHQVSKPKLLEIVQHAAERGEQDNLFRRINGDFPALGKSFRELSGDELSFMNSMCRERLYALNWTCDSEQTPWDEVACDT